MARALTPEHERSLRLRWSHQVGHDHEALEGLRHARADIGALLAELDQMRADRVRAETRSTQTLGELRRRADDIEARVRRAEAAVGRVQTVKVWANEDGRRFVFADDLLAAVAPDIALELSGPAAEPAPSFTPSGADSA